MSLEQKIEEVRKEKQAKSGGGGKKEKLRRLTWKEQIGAFRILWIFFLGVLAGVSWAYVILEFPKLFEPMIFTVVNEAHAQEAEEIVQVEEVMHNDVAELAEMIYNLESSNGKNNYSKCEEVGKINGIGYGIPGNGKYQCFDSHDDEMQVLMGWIIDKKAKGMTDNELLCLYSGNNYQICK